MVTKRLQMLTQTCRIQLQVCLSCVNIVKIEHHQILLFWITIASVTTVKVIILYFCNKYLNVSSSVNVQKVVNMRQPHLKPVLLKSNMVFFLNVDTIIVSH